MFKKISSESQSFSLKPTTQCTSTSRIFCSIVCLNVKKCFEKLLLKPIASAWSPPLTVLSQSAYFIQLYVWICIMLWKTSSENHCFCLKPTNQCTFKERILFLIVCLKEYNVSMTSSESHCLCLKPNTHCTFTERTLVQLYGLICLMFWKNSSDSHCSCLKPTTQCTSTELILCSIVCLNVYIVLKKNLKAIASAWIPRLSVLLQRAYFVQLYVWMCKLFLKNFFWKPLLLLEAHHSVYFHRAHTLFKYMFECV